MRPEIKGYAYCHTFCGHELELLIEVYLVAYKIFRKNERLSQRIEKYREV